MPDYTYPTALPPRIQDYIRSKVAEGYFPTAKEVQTTARSFGESVNTKAAEEYLKFFSHLAKISSKKYRPNHYVTLPIAKLGVIFIDLAFYKQEYAKENNGCIGFLCAVDSITQQLFTKPFKKKDINSWHDLVTAIVNESAFDVIRILVSDRESAVLSSKFRKKLLADRGINVVFIANRSKSYFAETFIRHVKKALSRTLAQVKHDNGNHKRWLEKLESITRYFNGKYAHNTKYRRKNIKRTNFNDYLKQLFNAEDASILFNMRGAIDVDQLAPNKWISKAFTLKKGTRVLVHKFALPAVSKEKFIKASVEGQFSNRPKIVHGRLLKKSADDSLVIPG